MKNQFKKTLVSSLSAVVVTATPLIDKEEGALVLKVSSTSPEIEWISALHLKYSSRSTHRGIFGLGWCSSLEWRFPSFGPLWIDACGDMMTLTQVSSQMRNQIKLNQKDGKLGSVWSHRGTQFRIINDLTGRPFQLSVIGAPSDRRQNNDTAINKFKDSQGLDILWDLKSNLIRQLGPLELRHQGLHLIGIGSAVNLGYDGLSNLVSIENKTQKNPSTKWSFSYLENLDLLKTAKTKECMIDYDYSSNAKARLKQTLITSQSNCRKLKTQLTVYQYQETPEQNLIPLQDKQLDRLSHEIHGTFF